MAERAPQIPAPGNCTGWLLDLYEDPQDGLALWLLQDGTGLRLRMRQHFSVTFFAAGPEARLRQLETWLGARQNPPRLFRDQRCDLFEPHPVPVLGIEVARPDRQPALFRQAEQLFPDLAYYDADLPLALRHAARFGTFPLARMAVTCGAGGWIETLRPLDTPWDLDPQPPPLRVLTLEPDVDPAHAPPGFLMARYERYDYRFPLEPARPLLINLRALLDRLDPDLLLASWGDTWLLPYLLEASQRLGLPLPLNREPGREVEHRRERTYFSYGQIVFRGQQVHLFGRWHIDPLNAMLWGDYALDGLLEAARVTALPVQQAARVSPGSGISAMQIRTALRDGILVPWHKQQAEMPKTALDLVESDMGGLVYQPLVGLHRDVGEIDFISMYPSIMVRFNISPETRGRPVPGRVPEGEPGLVPRTLSPLLDKRIALKQRAASLPGWDPRLGRYKARASAHKWLLVTCFGYLGYKNARFGRIEAHEAVTAHGREMLLRAKETVEDQGFTVLHMYVDGLWVQRPGANQVADFQPMLDEIARRTGLSIALDGILRWVAFLPSRRDARVPVANRYFGVFQDGTIKMRGIEARRKDTAPFIAEAQLELVKYLAAIPDLDRTAEYLPGAVALVRRRLADLRARRVPPEQLLVAQKLSRELSAYSSPSPAARAVAQLQSAGRSLRAGQRARFLYTLGEPGVRAWDLPVPPDPAAIDLARYQVLLLRAASAVLQPFGLDEAALKVWVRDQPGFQLPLPAPEKRGLPGLHGTDSKAT